MTMPNRRLGRSGLQVSVLSFGSWVSFGTQLDRDRALECMQAAYEGGMNFFDNAEAYAAGESEQIMGDAIAQLGWPRWSYTISTKVFWGIHDGVNMRKTLNRKYLLHSIDGSLERLGLDFVDLLFCHRPDPNTPIEETVFGRCRTSSRAARRTTGGPRSGRPTRSARHGRSRSVTTSTSR